LGSQREALKGEVDRAVLLVDEGLCSIGLGELNFVKQAISILVKPLVKAQPASLSPIQSPTPKEKTCLSEKREKGLLHSL
jgi:hypothetical protein